MTEPRYGLEPLVVAPVNGARARWHVLYLGSLRWYLVQFGTKAAAERWCKQQVPVIPPGRISKGARP